MIRTTYLKLKLLKNLFEKFFIRYYNSKGTRKVKDFQKPSNKEIYFTLQSNSTKYNKTFRLISCSNFLEGHHILSPEILGKTFTDWFKRCSDGYIFSVWYKLIHFFLPLNPAIHRMGNAPNILCSRCKENKNSLTPILYSIASCLKLL